MGGRLDEKRTEVLQRHYEVIVGTYRQQSDLYIKAYITYLAVIGGSGAYYFTQDLSPSIRVALLRFVLLASVLCLAGTVTGVVWVGRIQAILQGLERDISKAGEFEVELPSLPLYGGKVLGWVATVGVVLISAATIYLLVWVERGGG